MRFADLLDNVQLLDCGGVEPFFVEGTLGLDGALLVGEPLDVVEGESGDGEEKKDAERGHRQIDVEPARDRGCASAQDHGPGVFGGGGPYRGSV